ncbi:MAG: bifunctional glutamate N-acetyltransferase/amino-acid acetyltransferase ArgJ, partial [Candidatus Omnitrophota bacterium]|nr:bifunctional glutamate N-acetyltransferase/amino-acid acetyltransferase ArgJ [Candidatus Omnitrophota bacterium]
MKISSGGIAAPLGFKANGISCGIKKSGKKDLALIYSTGPALAAGMFTANRVKAAPLKITQKHLKNNFASAVIINSGNANCSTGKVGINDAIVTANCVASALNIPSRQVLVASTGIIGKRLPVIKIKKGIKSLVKGLVKNGAGKAAKAILTTDTKAKQIAVKIRIGGKTVTVGAMAKGAGMIYPNLATMLAFITTDAAIGKSALKQALRIAVDNSFNCITVDGCTSTNDMVLVLANGLAQNKDLNSRDLKIFGQALNLVCLKMAQEIIKDAEGATKFVKINVGGAPSLVAARKVGFAIANSLLFKTALFGQDENWGRIIAAIGQSGVAIEEEKIKISFTSFKNKDIFVNINLNMGNKSATIYTNDISFN